MESPKVGILMGSKSDQVVMRAASEILTDFGISWEMKVLSAHRTPEETRLYAESAEERGIDILIAGAGFAAHLGGVLAAHTTLPILGVPLDPSALKGLDALYATVQMPGGIPVATFTIGKAGAKNAALFAVQILSVAQPELRTKLKEYREKMRQDVLSAELD
jgi:phosphoribosylaminoimidazole carboxylase PurE protein